MKTRIKALALPSLKLLGAALSIMLLSAASSRLGVFDKGEHEYMFIRADGPKEWFSALELARAAKGYAESKNVVFAFEGTEPQIWVNTDGKMVLADVYWSHGIGKASLHVEIGRDGKPIRLEITIMGG